MLAQSPDTRLQGSGYNKLRKCASMYRPKAFMDGRHRSKRSCLGCIPCQKRDCIFCQIIADSSNSSATSRLIYQDDLVVALPDIRPAAAVHLLVLPRTHIPNVNSLEADDVQLVRHMMAVGQQLLRDAQFKLQHQGQQQQGPTLHQHGSWQPQQQERQPFKFGFHKPPFRSVDHLHLHCFILPHKCHRWIQYQSSLNWITSEELIDDLKRKPSVASQQQR